MNRVVKTFFQADQKGPDARRVRNRSFGGVYPERSRRAQDRLPLTPKTHIYSYRMGGAKRYPSPSLERIRSERDSSRAVERDYFKRLPVAGYGRWGFFSGLMKLRKIFAPSARPCAPCSLLPGRSSGFTLLEVVVAMTIVGLGVVTLLEIFSLGLRLGARSSVRTAGISYGRQALDEILLRRQIRDGTEEGAVNEMHRWKMHVEPVKDSRHPLSLSSDWELKEITLEMRVQEAGRESRVELKTLRLIKKKNP